MKWSIIIVSFNSKNDIGRCLSRLPLVDSEVIIVDNASTDSTPEFLKGVSARVIYNDTNKGFAAACNQGATLATGEFLLFLNPDAVMQNDVVTILGDIFRTHPDIAVLSPRIVDEQGSPERFSAGRFPTLLRLLLGSIAYDAVSETLIQEVDWVSGASLAIRARTFKAIEGFDEGFFMYYEDIDLCRRVREAGSQIGIAANATIQHQRGRSLGNNRLRKQYYYRSQLLYFKKHFGTFSAGLLHLLRLPAVLKNL